MTYSEAKLLSEVLASRVDLASVSHYECSKIEESEAREIIEAILMEYVEFGEK